jgi:hypothetical protein
VSPVCLEWAGRLVIYMIVLSLEAVRVGVVKL